MIENIKNKINSTRLNYASKKRKKILSHQIDTEKVGHLIKTVNCDHKWYGSSYGGFYINPKLITSDSIIYSFGIGKDITFDLACIKKHKCKVFAFDPTPKSINYIKNKTLPELFTFFDFGISDVHSGLVDFYLPSNPKGISGSLVKINGVNPDHFIKVKMKLFDEITCELGHQHINVLKMDIEGSEYTVLETILASNVTIDQILIEFHDRLFDPENYRSKEIIKKLKDQGYEIFAASISFEEISLIHKSKL